MTAASKAQILVCLLGVSSGAALCPVHDGVNDAGYGPQLRRVADAITRHEAAPPRLHNPGALVYAGQPNARRGKTPLAEFPDDQQGRDALMRDLKSKASLGLNLGETLRLWCPNGAAYAAIVARETGISEDEVLK